MKKNYHLYITIVLAPVITGLMLLSFYGKVDPANHRFLTTGWEYSWGDSDPQELASRQWLPAKSLGQPEGRNGQNFLWLRVPIPPGTVKTPTVFTEFVHQSMEVYMDGAMVYQYGPMPVPTEEKLRFWLPYHIIPLPEDAPGKILYLRIASSASSIGIFGGMEYGPMWGMYRYKNMIEFLKFSALALATAAGLWSFIVYLFYRRDTAYLAFTANALCGATIILSTTYNSFLFYPNPNFWNNWIIVFGLSWKVVWLQFLVYIVKIYYRQTVQRLVWLTIGISLLQMAAIITNPLWMKPVLAFNVLYSLGCYLAVLYVCRHQLRDSQEVQLYASGVSVWVVALTIDTLKMMGLLSTNLLVSWIGQMTETASLGIILILRYTAAHSQLREHAQNLESFNYNLENIVKERTEELSIQNSCLEQLFHNSPDAMVMLDLQHRIIDVNSSFEALFGYSAAEVNGQEIDALLDTAGEVSAAYIVQHGSIHLDTVRRHKDGSLIPVSLTAYPFIAKHHQVGIYIMYRDISERIRAEHILRESERKYRLLAENTDDVIWLMNFDKQLLYISPSAERLLGFKPEEVLHKSSPYPLNPQLRAAIDEVIDTYYRGEHNHSPVLLEEEQRSKDGSIIWIESSISIAHNEDGTLLGILGVTRNVTARKRTERLLFHTYERKRSNQFFHDILAGASTSEQKIYTQARHMRIHLPRSFAVCFCYADIPSGTDPQHQAMLLDEAVEVLDRLDGINAWSTEGGIGFICNLDQTPGCRQTEREIVETCRRELTMAFPQLRFHIGLAEYADSAAEFAARFRHACTAARIGSIRNTEKSIHTYEECGVYEIFDTFASTGEASGFVNRTLGPLLEYDRQNGTELMATLEQILMLPSLKEVAEQMNIHPKTVIARKQRIEKLLNVSLDEFGTRMMFGAALRLGGMLTTRKSQETV